MQSQHNSSTELVTLVSNLKNSDAENIDGHYESIIRLCKEYASKNDFFNVTSICHHLDNIKFPNLFSSNLIKIYEKLYEAGDFEYAIMVLAHIEKCATNHSPPPEDYLKERKESCVSHIMALIKDQKNNLTTTEVFVKAYSVSDFIEYHLLVSIMLQVANNFFNLKKFNEMQYIFILTSYGSTTAEQHEKILSFLNAIYNESPQQIDYSLALCCKFFESRTEFMALLTQNMLNYFNHHPEIDLEPFYSNLNLTAHLFFKKNNYTLAKSLYELVARSHSSPMGLQGKFQSQFCEALLENDPSLLEEPVSDKEKLSEDNKNKYIQTLNTAITKFSNKSLRIPSDLIRGATPQFLYHAQEITYNRFCPYAAESTFTKINMSSGDGGFDPYPDILPQHIATQIQSNKIKYYGYCRVTDELIKSMTTYFWENGILPRYVEPTASSYIAANGSTQVYSSIIKKLLDNEKDAVGKNIVLMHEPTYGLFLPQVYSAGGEVVTLPALQSNQYKLTSSQLANAIVETNQALFKNSRADLAIAYHKFINQLKDLNISLEQFPPFNEDTNLSYPEVNANLRDIRKTTVKVFAKHPTLKYLHPAQIPFPPKLPRVIALYFCNISVPAGIAYTQEEVNQLDQVRRHLNVAVIEDLTHSDLLFSSNKKLGHFGMSTSTPTKLVILRSISKHLCAAGWRAGFGFISPDLQHATSTHWGPQKSVNSQLFDELCFIDPLKMAALCIAHTEDKNRDLYLKKNNQEYRFRSNLFRCLIAGVAHVNLPNEEKILVINYVIENAPHLIRNLRTGVRGLRNFNDPEGSFFALVDFSALQNAYLGEHRLTVGRDFYEALLAIFNIDTISSEGLLCNEKPLLRFSLNISRRTIFEAVKRLNQFSQLFVHPTHAPDRTLTNNSCGLFSKPNPIFLEEPVPCSSNLRKRLYERL